MNAGEFAKANPEAVQSWKGEGGKAAEEAERTRFAELGASFKDRPAFVIDQFSKGHTVDQAKADLADVLLSENAEQQAEIEKLKKAKPESKGELSAGENEGAALGGGDLKELGTGSIMKLEDRCRAEWDSDPKIRKSFMEFEDYVEHKQLLNSADLTEDQKLRLAG